MQIYNLILNIALINGGDFEWQAMAADELHEYMAAQHKPQNAKFSKFFKILVKQRTKAAL